jgi:RNA polymerase sigma-70 factor (ECF subfamily)
VHADASTLQETDWPQIVVLYDRLLAVAPTPVVALNRAIAIGEVQGPAAAHASRSAWAAGPALRGAAAAYERAAAMAPTKAERDFLRLGGRASR